MKYRVEVNGHDGRGWRLTKWGVVEQGDAGDLISMSNAIRGMAIAKVTYKEPEWSYRIVDKTGREVSPAKRSHHNTPRKTARERAVYVIKRGAMAEDIEKQIQLAVKAYAKRKARR